MSEEEVDPAQVAEAVKGLSDEELTKQIEERGVDKTLQQIFAGMQDAFKPEKAAGVNAVIQYDIALNGETKQWSVNIADGKCETSEGASENPRITLQVNLPDFMRLIFNQADGTQLFMSGKLKLKGDMMFAMQMQNFFERQF
jgi:putative sterol carrier protein